MQYLYKPEVIDLTAGTIDEESVKGKLPEVKSSIFVSEGKGRWDVEVRGPIFEGFSEGMQRNIDAWKELHSGPGVVQEKEAEDVCGSESEKTWYNTKRH